MKGPIEWFRIRREHRWTHGHISAYFDHDLGPHERARAEAHMSICPQCRRVLATLRAMVDHLREIGTETPAGVPDSGVAERVIEALRRGG